MNFDDHEIWGAPVRASESVPENPVAETAPPAATTAAAGRLYRSAGSDPHPEAILALPQHRRHTTVQPLESTQWASSSAPSAPITINSRIPRPTTVEDPALAEIAGGPATPAAPAGYTSWFKSSNPLGAIVAMRQTNTGVAQPAPRNNRLDALAALGGPLSARTYSALVFVLTAVVGVVNAAVSGTLGMPTGVALVIAVAIGSLRIDSAERWAAWVMPAYALIAALLIAGQFTDSAPGASPLGQVMLVVTELITLAPWLAGASVIGALLPGLRGRAN